MLPVLVEYGQVVLKHESVCLDVWVFDEVTRRLVKTESLLSLQDVRKVDQRVGTTHHHARVPKRAGRVDEVGVALIGACRGVLAEDARLLNADLLLGV